MRTPPRISTPLTALHALAHRQAAHQHLRLDLREDCAQDFVLHALQHPALLHPQQSHAYLLRSATHFTCNFRRHHIRITRHEVVWPKQTDEEGCSSDQEFVQHGAGCEAQAVQQEARQRLHAAMQRLTSSQRYLLIRHVCYEETFVDLARASGSTPDAVRLTIHRALKRLRVLLMQQGMTEEDADEYLAEIAKVRGGGRTTKPRAQIFLKKVAQTRSVLTC